MEARAMSRLPNLRIILAPWLQPKTVADEEWCREVDLWFALKDKSPRQKPPDEAKP
jgi:hypothetical protein